MSNQRTKGAELRVLLARHAPRNERGKRSLPELATKLNITRQALNGWFRRGRIPADRALDVIAATNNRIKFNDLAPYVLAKRG